MEQTSPLRRTPTHTTEPDLDDAASLTAVQSANSSVTSSSRPPHRLMGRTPSSHSLLGTPKNNTDIRKPPQAETIKASANRSSISMPPPITKPSSDRRLSASFSVRSARRSEEVSRSPPASFQSLDGDRILLGASAQTSTIAHDLTVVTTASAPLVPGLPVLSPPAFDPSIPNQMDLVSTVPSQVTSPSAPAPKSDGSIPAGQPMGPPAKPDGSDTALPSRAPRVTQPRSISSNRRLSTAGSSKNESINSENRVPLGRIGVCALDIKARSRPSRQILTRLQGDNEFEVIVFGDKAILDESKLSTSKLLGKIDAKCL